MSTGSRRPLQRYAPRSGSSRAPPTAEKAGSAPPEPAIDRKLSGAVDRDHQHQRAPQVMILEARIAQVGIRDHRNDVEDEERERRGARADSQDKQHRQAKLGHRTENGGD